jgi:CHAD domain-containing protein
MVIVRDRGELVVDDGVSRPLAVVAAALAADFAVVSEASHAVRRTWLDTFDWRLFRAGLTLEHVGDTERGELRLATVAGEPVARSATAGAAWPGRLNGALNGALGSELGGQLVPLVGVRALLPMAETTGSIRALRLLNADDKTVVRAVVEQRTLPAHGRLASRVSVVPVRGYDREARLARRRLLAAAGIAANIGSPLDEALAALGRRAGDYSGIVEVTLSATAPASTAMASVLLHVLDVLEANVDGVVRDLDTEFLHDLRIAVRRTRSGLALAGDALPAGLAERFAGEFKWLGRLSTPVRDLDACLESLDDADPDDLEAVQPLRRYLEQRRLAAWPDLVAGLQSRRFAELVSSWRAALLDVPPHGIDGERSVALLATARITRGYNRILKPGRAITPSSPAEDLHELRKRGKELRYLLEYFASLHPPAPHRAMIKELKSVQDCLGRFQDSQIQRQAIMAVAGQMADELDVPAATLRAMDRLAARLDMQEREARDEFAGRFKRFAGARIVGLLMALAEPTTG